MIHLRQSNFLLKYYSKYFSDQYNFNNADESLPHLDYKKRKKVISKSQTMAPTPHEMFKQTKFKREYEYEIKNTIDEEECHYDEFMSKNLRYLTQKSVDDIDPDRLQVYSMQSGHFSINRVWHSGSVILFPSNAFFWEVSKPSEITSNSLRIFEVIKPRPDILLIGTGRHGVQIDQRFIDKFKNLGIILEYDASFEICCLFNTLNEEKRNVAMACLPINVEELGVMNDILTLPSSHTVQFPDDLSPSLVGQHKWQIRQLEKAEEKLLLEDMKGASYVGDSDDESLEQNLLEGGYIADDQVENKSKYQIGENDEGKDKL
eukprot:Mrub_05776.p1 GENE.Mrub_05776~~Mrub_05776.p1  ORF type:complete len:318 (-),score=90.45 Mrub_05776:100-1053(-)